MFHVFDESVNPNKLPEWLTFGQSDSYEPFSGNWTRIYHRGSNTIETPYGELNQFIHAFPALVDLNDVDTLRDENPYGRTWELEFSHGGGVWTSTAGHYWDDGTTRTFGAVELARFLTTFQYNRPQLEPGFIGYFDLVDEGHGDYATYHTGDPVVQFSGDQWEEDIFGGSPLEEENTHWLNIQTSYLLDYLDARDAALIIGYFEARELHPESSVLDMDEESEVPVTVFDGPAVRSLKHVPVSSPYHLGELHWLCPILPTSKEASVGRQLEQNKQLTFITGDGNEVSVADLEAQSSAVAVGWVYFEMDVLEKYIDSQDGKIEWDTTEMGTIEYQDRTIASIFRNDEHEVVLFVDDLEKLPAHELPRWKVHNRTPVGQLPDDAFKTQILAEFVDSDHPSYSTRVLDALDKLSETFENAHGTPLVDDLGPGDNVESVIMPARNDQDQLVDSMVALNKILFERMESHLEDTQEFLPEDCANDVNGTKSALYEMAAFLFDEDEAGELLDPLNAVYWLRQHGSHRGSSNWARAIEAVDLQHPVRDYRDAYVQIMTQTAESLEAIETRLAQK
ncbi:hypothetical protein V9T20_12905 (plasmid) [Halobacterium salinarum]|uniref:hypothetical protein n=1 Tax=Halobacterium salinarum TaxID=2242 RepID=UPI0030D253EE